MSVTAPLSPTPHPFLSGRWVKAAPGKTFDIVNSSTGEVALRANRRASASATACGRRT